MSISEVKVGPRKELCIGMLGCGFMGKCHTNAYKKIPYFYPSAGFTTRLAVLCDQKAEIVEREAARYGFEAYCDRLEGVGRRRGGSTFSTTAGPIRFTSSRASPRSRPAST